MMLRRGAVQRDVDPMVVEPMTHRNSPKTYPVVFANSLHGAPMVGSLLLDAHVDQAMNHDLASLFAEPLFHLGGDDPRFRQIFAPRSERDAEKRGVTSQFLENADEYHRRYANVEYFRALIDNSVEMLKPIDPRVILDIGSGSGNSVIPLLDKFPKALIVATDISPQLLAILREFLDSRAEYRGRYALVCMDACNDHYRPGVFDLALGAAILHHIIEPAQVLDSCARALRPGGAAIFFEPFEMGHALLSLAYREIIEEATRRGDESRGIATLRHVSADYTARLGGQVGPELLQLDDKWMFTRDFFESMANRGVWSECYVYPIHGSTAPLTEQTRINLRLVTDAEPSVLPAWAWDMLSQYETAFSPKTRRDLIFEGAAVMRTGSGAPIQTGSGSGWWWNPAESGRGFFLEFRNDQVCAACCLYGDDGLPTWLATDWGPLLPSGEMSADLRVRQFPRRPERMEAESARPTQEAISIQFAGTRTAVARLGATAISLEVQNAQNPGRAAHATSSLTGWWIDDAQQAECAALVEILDDRVIAALLRKEDWCITVAARRGTRSYAGEWLQFLGGQTIHGPYRAPTS